jgi:hypothetical protein
MKIRKTRKKFEITIEYRGEAKAMIEKAAIDSGLTPYAFALVGHRLMMDVLSEHPEKARALAQNIGKYTRFLELPPEQKN